MLPSPTGTTLIQCVNHPIIYIFKGKQCEFQYSGTKPDCWLFVFPYYISSYLVLGILCRKIFILSTTKYPYHARPKMDIPICRIIFPACSKVSIISKSSWQKIRVYLDKPQHCREKIMKIASSCRRGESFVYFAFWFLALMGHI